MVNLVKNLKYNKNRQGRIKMYEIEYNGEKIPYEITKSKIKNLYIHIKEGKVIVKAPLKLKEKHIVDFVNKKSKWIYKNVKEVEKRVKKENIIKSEDIQKLEMIVNNSVQEYSEKLGISPNKVKFKNIKYAWGSCSSKKNISINIQLATKEEQVIKYVVLHEMCHLKYMNHSKDFWNLVENYMPNYKIYKKRLKAQK